MRSTSIARQLRQRWSERRVELYLHLLVLGIGVLFSFFMLVLIGILLIVL